MEVPQYSQIMSVAKVPLNCLRKEGNPAMLRIIKEEISLK